MKIRNTTTISEKAIRDVVAFVRPPGIGGFTLRLTNTTSGERGWACWSTNTVTIRLHRISKPHLNGDKRERGYLPRPATSGRLEALVYLMAHELRHLWQAQVPRGRRVWGARGQFSERDACAYGIRMLRAWRREH